MVFLCLAAIVCFQGTVELERIADAKVSPDGVSILGEDGAIYTVDESSHGYRIERYTKPTWRRILPSLPGSYLDCRANDKGVVFFSSTHPGPLLVLDPRSGRKMWSRTRRNRLPASWIFNCAAVALDHDSIYSLDNRQISAWWLSSGKPRWSRKLPGLRGTPNIQDPLVSDAMVYAVYPAKEDKDLRLKLELGAFHIRSGKVAWKRPYGLEPTFADRPISPPTLWENWLLSLEQNRNDELVLRNAHSGQEIWRRTTSHVLYPPQSLATDGRSVVVGPSMDWELKVSDFKSGKAKGTLGWGSSGVCLDGQVLYVSVGPDPALNIFDPERNKKQKLRALEGRGELIQKAGALYLTVTREATTGAIKSFYRVLHR